METVVKNVGDLNACDLHSLEHVLGRALSESQQLVIHIVDIQGTPKPQSAAADAQNGGAKLPDWCNVYAGLSDEEIAELEKVILQRADLSRSFE